MMVRSHGPSANDSIGLTQDFVGSIEGRLAGTEYGVVKPDNGAAFDGSGTFTGSIAGCSRTASVSYEATAQDCPLAAPLSGRKFRPRFLIVGARRGSSLRFFMARSW